MDERKQKLIALAGQVLAYLTPWYIDHNHDYYNVKAVHPDKPDAALWFNLDRGRLHIQGGYPQDFHPYSGAPEISVSARRSPQSIAKDIHRRFLPDYLEVYARCMENKRQGEEALRLTNAALDELGKLVGQAPRYAELNRYGSLYVPHGSMEVHPSSEPSFRFKLHSVPLAVAWEICRVLGETE